MKGSFTASIPLRSGVAGRWLAVLVAILSPWLGTGRGLAQQPPTDEEQFIAQIKTVLTDFKFPNNFPQKDMAELFQNWVDNKKLTIKKLASGDNADYYGGEIGLSENALMAFVSNNRKPVRMREAANYQLATSVAQSLVHEFRHASDDKAYYDTTGGFMVKAVHGWSGKIETDGWNQGQAALEGWLTTTWKQHEANPTRETAMKLVALTYNWLIYDDNMVAKGLANTTLHIRINGMNVLHPKWREEIITLQTKVHEEWELAEILTTYPGPPPLTNKETFDELMGRLPPGLVTEKDFEDFFRDLNLATVAQRAGFRREELGDKAKTSDVNAVAERRFKSHYPAALDRWKATKERFEQQAVAAALSLGHVKLRLSYTPLPAVVDPKTQKATVVVTVEPSSQQEFETQQAALEDLLRKATGQAPKLTVIDTWTPSPDGREPTYTLPPPEPFAVQLTRVVTLSPETKAGRDVTLASDTTTIRFASEVPQSLAGRWEGGVVVEAMPLWEGMAPQNAEAQGCLQALAPLKGKELRLICIVNPQEADSGKVTATITFPKELRIGPVTYNLTYSATPTSFSAVGDSVSLTGHYSRADPGWTISGNLNWHLPNAKKTAAMTGRWWARNSGAK